MYPNPSSGVINFEFASKAFDHVEITNQLGVIVRRIPISQDQEYISIDLTNEPKGIYFYNLKSQNLTMESGKIILIDN